MAGTPGSPECPHPISALAFLRMRRLRVMTYNIHRGRGVDRRIDLGRIADVVASFEPDVVALQEVDIGRKRSGRVDQAGELGKRLGMEVVFCPCIEWGDG